MNENADSLLEIQIQFAFAKLLQDPCDDNWQTVRTLVMRRSPEQVRAMEEQRGLV